MTENSGESIHTIEELETQLRSLYESNAQNLQMIEQQLGNMQGSDSTASSHPSPSQNEGLEMELHKSKSRLDKIAGLVGDLVAGAIRD